MNQDLVNVHLPIAQMSFSVPSLLGLGLCVGVLGGFFGVGAGWIVTPALNMFGFDMSFAIGTDLAYVFGNSIVAARKHSKLGNLDVRLGLVSIVGSVAGVELGAQSVLALERAGDAGAVVRGLYMALLFGLGTSMTYGYVRASRQRRAPRPSSASPALRGPGVSRRLRSLRIPPLIALPDSGIDQVSLLVLLGLFTVVGFLSGFMGVGGGFILLPSLIYLIGCPTAVAVGTSLFCVLLMAAYGSFSYALKGRTELAAAALVLMGSALGAQIGALATRHVRGYGIRLLFAVMILIAGVSVTLKQAQGVLNLRFLGPLAGDIVLVAAGGMSLLIALKLVQAVAAERKLAQSAEKKRGELAA